MVFTSHPKYTPLMLAQCIDHTKLTFTAAEDVEQAIDTLCQEAITHQFYAVCVRPEHIKRAKQALGSHNTKVATVIGFPEKKRLLNDEQMAPTVGGFPTEFKLQEVKTAITNGVDELDLVLNVAAFKQELEESETLPSASKTLQELQAIQQASQGCPVKVIIETDLLSDAEVIEATKACAQAGVFMVKTSTGMLMEGIGATPKVVSLIRNTLNTYAPDVQIKASGGIKTTEQALVLLEKGANRLGTSSGGLIVAGLK